VIVAVASGKGGVGKTTVATNLACVAARAGRSVAFLDCDVEEPNGAIFLKPRIEEDRAVCRLVPRVDLDQCDGCGECERMCRFSAIVAVKGGVETFPELCRSCGGCQLVCPQGAIREEPREIGRLQIGRSRRVPFVQGVLNVGQAMSPPVIRAVKRAAPPADVTIIDCPPGASCPVIAAVRGADCVLLVAEPTPFGLADLRIAVETVRSLALALGVVINRADIGDDSVRRYCDEEDIPVLAEIPDVRAVAEAYARGVLAAEVSEHCRQGFERLLGELVSPAAEAAQ